MGATHYIPRAPALAAACARFNRGVLARLRSDPRIRIVVLGAAWAAPFYRDWEDGWLVVDSAQTRQAPSADTANALFTASLRATISSLDAAGKQVLVVEDAPEFPVNPLWRVESARISARRRLDAWLRIAGADDPGVAPADNNPLIALSNSLLEEAVARSPGAGIIRLRPALCAASNLCAYRRGEQLLYADSSHLSAAGAIDALGALRLAAPGGTPNSAATP